MIEDATSSPIGYIERDMVLDQYYNTIGYLVFGRIEDMNHNPICYVKGDILYDSTLTAIAYIYSNRIEDSMHNTVGYIHNQCDKSLIAILIVFRFISILLI